MKDEPWRGDMHARCLHLEAKLGRQAREIERMERNLAEAKALLRDVSYEGYRIDRDDNPRDDIAILPLGWFTRRDALLNPTTEPKETQQ